MKRVVAEVALLAICAAFGTIAVGGGRAYAAPCPGGGFSQKSIFFGQLDCGSGVDAEGQSAVEHAGQLPPSATFLVGSGACVGAQSIGASSTGPSISCQGDPAQPGITNALVVSAVKKVQPPAAGMVVQPPGGKTLVNFDTIFSAKTQPINRTVRLLGHELVLRIWASSFTWHFRDGSASLTTTEPGRPYQQGLPMDSYITHQYSDANVTVHPRVDTTYSAEYSVDGQAFQPVIGTVTIAGVPASLRVVEARPALTGTR